VPRAPARRCEGAASCTRAEVERALRLLRRDVNYDALARLWHEVVLTCRKWLSRRSQKAYLSWINVTRLLERYPLPPPRIVHRYVS
jgi:hypothetical protein